MAKQTETKIRRKLRGVVVSDKAEKTVVVRVETKKPHPKYGKIIKSHKKYHAHDEKNQFKIGDVITIVESAPYSKTKTWEVIYKED